MLECLLVWRNYPVIFYSFPSCFGLFGLPHVHSGHSLLWFDPLIEVWSTDTQEGYSLFFVLDDTAARDVSKPGISILSELQGVGSRARMLRWGCRIGARSGFESAVFPPELMFSQLWSDKVNRGRWIFCYRLSLVWCSEEALPQRWLNLSPGSRFECFSLCPSCLCARAAYGFACVCLRACGCVFPALECLWSRLCVCVCVLRAVGHLLQRSTVVVSWYSNDIR